VTNDILRPGAPVGLLTFRGSIGGGRQKTEVTSQTQL
jgi:hypothetical protein